MPHIPRNIQSPYTATDFWNKWGSVNPRMALFFKTQIARGDEITVIGFTSNSRDMTLPGHSSVTFRSAVGLSPSSIQSQLNAITTLELQGFYESIVDGFLRQELVAGRWDGAEFEIFSAAWDTPEYGELVHFVGNFSDFKDYETFFVAEGRGLIGRLSQDVAVVTSRGCRVKQFRNSECGYTGTTVTVNGETYSLTLESETARLEGDRNLVTIVDASINITTDPSGNDIPLTDFFNSGVITINEGGNAGVSREILKYEYDSVGDAIFVYVKRAFPIDDDSINSLSVTIAAGCNRTVENCRKYGNIINFRGEPYVPGIEAMNRIPPSN